MIDYEDLAAEVLAKQIAENIDRELMEILKTPASISNISEMPGLHQNVPEELPELEWDKIAPTDEEYKKAAEQHKKRVFGEDVDGDPDKAYDESMKGL